MNVFQVLWLLTAVVTSVQWAHAKDECVVVTPNALRLGASETVVAIVSGQRQRVRVSLQSHPVGRAAFFETTFDVAPGKPTTAEVSVKPDDLSELQLSKEEVQVTLTVQCGTLWTRQVLLAVSGSSADLLFLQTDKPIYHPGSNVHIRFIALNGSLLPASTPFKLEVRNPQNVVLEEKNFVPDRELMLSHQFIVPKHTVLGEWKLVMRYGHKLQQNTTATFAVEKYVLPRFSVTLKTVDYILPDFNNITINVRAKFVNKQYVRGVVSFRFSVKNELGPVEEIGTSGMPKTLQSGDAVYTLARGEVVDRLGERRLGALFEARARLVVEATVIEEATGIRETSRSEQAVFSTSPFLVSTARSEKSFKPGAKFYVTADVTYANGEPAANVPTKLTCENCHVSSTTYSTNENGVVTFFVASRTNDTGFKFMVETADPKYRAKQQARNEFSMNLYRDNSGKYMFIQRKDPKTLFKVYSTFEAILFTSQKIQVMSAYYVVLSRGRVLKAGKVATGPNVLEHRVTFIVTPEMSPSFRVLVVGFLDGQLATDAIYVNAEPTCTKGSHFTLEREHRNEMLEPGASETLVLKGKAGTRVGLLGVDQAVYLLRRKDLLTRRKVFQSMEAKDLGRGLDAGTAALHALANSGVAVLAAQGAYGGAGDDRRRAKRDVTSNILEGFQDETLRNCCSSGLQKDPFLRSCSEREEALRSYLIAGSALYSDKCVEAFFTCCKQVEDNQPVGRSNDEVADVLGNSGFDFSGKERRDFRETWLFQELTIGEGQKTTYEVSLPDTITTWELSAVSVAPSGGICVHDPLEIRVFKKLFVEVNLPYSVIKNEQVEIPVTVYNYDRSEQVVRVVMLGTRDVCSGAKEGKPSAVRKLTVPKGQGRTVMFPVVPLAAGEREIHVVAVSDSSAKDAAKVTLRVEPPGVRKEESFNLILDPENTQKRKERDVNTTHGYTETFAVGGKQLIQIQRPRRSPQEVIPGSERCEIDIIGDDMGVALEASVKSPESLLRMPSGCGEQTMITLAPTLYAYEYLKTADLISSQDEDRALGFIRSGYQRMLTFRKLDGSFSVWNTYTSSLWLTAFVVRSLCEARKSVLIDENVLTSGLHYILTQQQQDGRFHDISKLIHGDLLGGVTGPLPLTAYTLLTLQECAKDGIKVPGLKESYEKATAFIGKELERDQPAYETSLAAYALSLGDSPAKNNAIRKLRSILQPGQRGGQYVSAGSDPLSVQATSYALMALLKVGESRDTVTALVQWLNLRMNPSGSLSTSQDTVVALQALSKYAIYARNAGIDLTCEVTLSGDKAFNRTVRIKRDNAQVRNRIEIPQFEDKIFLNVKGSGTATMYFVTSHDEPVGAEFLCKFKLDIDFRQNKVSIKEALKDGKGFKETYAMKVCARSLEEDVRGMAILDVGLMSGFKPVAADLQELVNKKIVDHYELSQRSVVFYLPTIPADKDVCVEFGLDQEFTVGKLQSSSVKAYAYYNPDISCTKFYAPNRSSPLLKMECKDPGHSDVCMCLEGGCPPENLREMFTKNGNEVVMTAECREALREHACDEVDFAWLGTAQTKTYKDGFLEVRFFITKVLKPGIETEEDLANYTRVIKARDHCESFQIKEGSEYIIMGMDAKYKVEDLFGDEQYEYLMDSDTIVIEMPSKENKIVGARGRAKNTNKSGKRRGRKTGQNPANEPCDWDKLVLWFKNEFSNETTRCFT
ncbi:venom factor-like [Dermacentor andersoni]|uniref:venom factor-like n=1 Tax=Dermacentor andersoni TaxID=34620 RepID=UPI002155604F|nr:venom factor-like [Dermacentor andersoni]